jgi:hypothetical protein
VSRRSKLLILWIVAGLGAIAWVLSDSSAPSFAPVAHIEDVLGAKDNGAGESPGLRGTNGVNPPTERRVGEGRPFTLKVTESTFGTPVAGWCHLDEDGPGYAFEGEFNGRATEGLRFTLEVPNCQTTAWAWTEEADDISELVVHPIREAEVFVQTSSGDPVPGATIHWQDSSGSTFETVETTTGVDGQSTLPVHRAARLHVEHEGRSTTARLVEPGCSVVCTLPDGMHTLEFQTADGSAVPDGHRLEVHRTGEHASEPRVVEIRGGRVRIPSDPNPVVLVFDRPGLEFTTATGPNVHRKQDVELVLWSAPPGDTTQLAVHDPALRVRLIDAETGAPIEGRVLTYVRRTIVTGTWCADSRTDSRATDGWVHVVRFDPERIDPEVERLFLQAEGYAEVEILDLLAFLQPDALPLTIACDRTSRRTIRLVDVDRNPVQLRAQIRLLETGEIWRTLSSDAHGDLGPFDWNGTDLLLVHQGAGTPFAPGVQDPHLAQVSADFLRDEEHPTVVVSVERGQLEVRDVPLGTEQLFARNLNSGQWHRASIRSKTGYVFDGLTTGAILVGPQPWVEQLYTRRRQDLGRLAVSIVEGERTVVDWDPRWATPEGIDGEVVLVSPSPVAIFLIPVYGTTKAALPLGRMTPSIDVDGNGHYRIAAGRPVPELLLVASRNPAGDGGAYDGHAIRVHGSTLPGARSRLSLSSIEFVWEGGPPNDGAVIEFVQPRDRLSNPARDVVLAYWDDTWAPWSGGETFVLGALDSGVTQVRFRTEARSWNQFVELIPGEVTRVVVVPPTD